MSTAGGVDSAPGRAAEIGCACLQLFTKQPTRWAEPTIDAATAEAPRLDEAHCGAQELQIHNTTKLS